MQPGLRDARLGLYEGSSVVLIVIGLRYVVRAYFGVHGGDNPETMDPRALIAMDALLTFAIGLVIATRTELFLRMRAVPRA